MCNGVQQSEHKIPMMDSLEEVDSLTNMSKVQRIRELDALDLHYYNVLTVNQWT
jgi:hypothetical protein